MLMLDLLRRGWMVIVRLTGNAILGLVGSIEKQKKVLSKQKNDF